MSHIHTTHLPSEILSFHSGASKAWRIHKTFRLKTRGMVARVLLQYIAQSAIMCDKDNKFNNSLSLKKKKAKLLIVFLLKSGSWITFNNVNPAIAYLQKRFHGIDWPYQAFALTHYIHYKTIPDII